MQWIKALVAAMCLVWAVGAPAETWRHPQSGISIDIPADLRLGEARDLYGDGTDVSIQLGTGDTIVTLFVYRAAYPNVALWYDRARRAIVAHLPIDANAAPRPFALAGATSPNGLRETFELPAGQRMRATGVALAGYGEWLVKLRISSAGLGRDQLSRLMDGVLGGIRSGTAPASNLPLILPADCPSPVAFDGRRIAGESQDRAGLGSGLQAIQAAARGRAGLASEPGAWCRLDTDLPGNVISVFRRNDNGGWVALLGDAGAAMTALRLGGNASDPVAVYGSNPSGNQLLYLYDDIPAPAPEVERGGAATLAIRARGT